MVLTSVSYKFIRSYTIVCGCRPLELAAEHWNENKTIKSTQKPTQHLGSCFDEETRAV
jgi:hypothetical protein